MEDPIPHYKKRFTKRFIVMLIIVIVIFGGVFGFDIMRGVMMKKFFANFAPPPVVISVAAVQADSWQPFIHAVGSVVPDQGVNVTSEVAGLVMSIPFQSGQDVAKGTLLVQLDDRVDQQDLKNFEAQLVLAKLDYDRQSQLLTKSATAVQLVDRARANLEEVQANVGRTKVEIDQKGIKAPFAGRVGIRLVNLGQFISPGNPVVNLQSLDPVHVDFSLPERYLKELYINQPVNITTDSFGDKIFQGKITALNSEFNSETRNILIRATFPNPEKKLLPGMFATISVLLPEKKDVLTVPQTAITYNLYGDSVYIIQESGKDKKGEPILKATLRYVEIGDRRKNQVAIIKGIKAGEQVATSGQLKLNEGAVVKINNSIDVSTFNSSLEVNPQ